MNNLPSGICMVISQNGVNTVQPLQVLPGSIPGSVPGPMDSQSQSLQNRFLKGEPKALGVVQIMIALMSIVFWTSMSAASPNTPVLLLMSAPLFYLISGSCSVATANKFTPKRVKCTLGMNIVSCAVAVLEIIFILSSQLDRNQIINHAFLWTFISFLIIFTVLEFSIALSTSVFGCKVLCCGPTE
ncbi:membrane-spanning 4-domains subfamily A member 4A-like isoform X3 [Hemicordylus capensis]|nr:membrane-spanning 4-domains subfamily A member 4A-like isoform X3 [Hemicordylus capensis]